MIVDDYAVIQGVEIQIISFTGQLVRSIKNTDESGEILTCRVDYLKIGGVDKIEFTIDNKTDFPTYAGMIIHVIKDSELVATGYSDTVPQPDSTKPTLKISCLGFFHKLKKQNVKKTYSGVTLEAIILDLEPIFNLVDIFIDSLILGLPNITVTNIDFSDKTLLEAVTAILQILNFEYADTQYRWYIDNDRFLRFELIDNTPITSLFEGYDYQNPEVETEEKKIINRVLAYKEDPLDSQKLTYVGTYEDTKSQGDYGIIDKKIIYPDTVADAEIAKMAQAIISEFKDPLLRMEIDNLPGTNFPFAFYNLSNRRENYWQIVSECEDLENWDLTNIGSTVVAVSDEQVLTGRKSIKCTTGTGSNGTTLSFIPEDPYYGVNFFKMFIYFDTSINLEVEVESADGSKAVFEFGKFDANLVINQDAVTTKNLRVLHTSINNDSTNNNYGRGVFGGAKYGK